MSVTAPKGYEMLQFPTRGGQSANIYSQLGGDYFQKLLGMAQQGPQMGEMEKYGQDIFQQQIAPGIASRYAGSGIGASSGMQNSIAGAGANLASELASKRQDLMHQSIQDVLGLGHLLLSNPDVENYYRGKSGKSSGSIWDKIFGIGLPIAGGIAGGIFGGPMGAAAGLSLGNTLGSGFTGQSSGTTDWSGIGSLPKTWKS